MGKYTTFLFIYILNRVLLHTTIYIYIYMTIDYIV